MYVTIEHGNTEHKCIQVGISQHALHKILVNQFMIVSGCIVLIQQQNMVCLSGQGWKDQKEYMPPVNKAQQLSTVNSFFI